MIFGPYERRIDKHTRVNGEVYYKVLYSHVGWWGYLTEIKFKTFGAAVVWVRNYDLQQVKESKTISRF
jgi:hypothetical protein